jgi:hypothetical protein
MLISGGPDDNITARLRSLSALMSSGPPEMLTSCQQGPTLLEFGSASLQARRFLER